MMISLIITLANSINLYEIFDEGAKKIKTSKRSIILTISSTELTKLKRLIKFQKTGGSVRLNPWIPQPEPQLQPYEIMKRCQQVSKCNGCKASFDKTGKNLDTLGGKGLEWYGKITVSNKQHKIPQRKMLLLCQ